LVELGELQQGPDDEGMLGPRSRLADRQRAPIEVLRLGRLSKAFGTGCQLPKATDQSLRMVAHGLMLLVDGQYLAIDRRGSGVVFPAIVDAGQPVEVEDDSGVIGPVGWLPDREGPPEDLLQLSGSVLGAVEPGQGVEGPGEVGVLGPQSLLRP